MHDPNWWNTGDRVDGYRQPGLNWVNKLTYNLQISDNVLSGGGHVDLDLSINGIIVGNFTILPGQTSKSLTFSFPAISGPGYSIRLRETNTVGPGLGSIELPINTSSLTLIGNTFPATGDSLVLEDSPDWFWYIGDRAVGYRTPGIEWIDGLIFDLQIGNYLSAPGHVDFNLTINDILVGSFTVLPGETSKSVTFSFPQISGPVYQIWMEVTNTVDPGKGSIEILLDSSTITFIGDAFPAAGDTMIVANSPYWWTAGDYALGTRKPGLDWVNSVRYDLLISRNVLGGTGHIDFELSINGIIVGQFTVLPGTSSMNVTFFFPKINGPNYVIKLKELNTVDPGMGSVVIPLNISTIHLFGNKFPADGDTMSVTTLPYWWHVNDNATGSRRLDMGWVTGVTYNLQGIQNFLSGTGHIDLKMYINNILVGSFTILPGEVTKTVSFTFPMIRGPNYAIKLKETNLVDPGMGSIVIPFNKSTITFRTGIYTPNLAK
ncbi:MAG: hypothetical protein FIA98_05690 [Anaerolineae bacterium]|nr:hypothetical protein [Anaerolineae bacterium]